MLYRSYRIARYGYGCRTELTEVSGIGVDVFSELTEVLGTGIVVLPNLPKCPVPVIPAVYTSGMPQ